MCCVNLITIRTVQHKKSDRDIYVYLLRTKLYLQCLLSDINNSIYVFSTNPFCIFNILSAYFSRRWE